MGLDIVHLMLALENYLSDCSLGCVNGSWSRELGVGVGRPTINFLYGLAIDKKRRLLLTLSLPHQRGRRAAEYDSQLRDDSAGERPPLSL
jgi:hypothetical protein